MDLGLAGRAYVVTGGSRGLGRATADVLLAEGASVVVTGRDADRLAGLAEGPHADRVRTLVADNGDPDVGERVVAAAREAFGRLDGALVSVGGPPPGSVLSTGDEAWTQAFGSVFLGALRVARAVVGALEEGGSLAFVLSTSVRAPIGGLAVSNGLRPGLAMVAKTLADEVGPRGIRVNGLLPGRVDTERVRQLDASADDPEAARAAATAGIPLRRSGRPEEFGRVAAFLLSPAAGYVTGAMVPVDGGLTRAL